MRIQVRQNDILPFRDATVVGRRQYDERNPAPGTRIALHPTGECAANIIRWGRDNDIVIPQAPYGLLHVTLIATARTLDVPVMKLTKPLLIQPAEIRLRIIRDHARRPVLWAMLDNPTLNNIITTLHRTARVVPQSPPHMTLSYRVRDKSTEKHETLPFAISLRSMTICAYSVGDVDH